MHSVSVAGVTFDEAGRVLVIRRRDNGQWQAPGGVLEIGETFEHGVAREVLEETGVRVEVDALTGIYKNVSHGIVALVYRCRALSGEPVPTDESEAVRWMPIEEALARMETVFGIRVQDARDAPRLGAFSRTHDGQNLL